MQTERKKERKKEAFKSVCPLPTFHSFIYTHLCWHFCKSCSLSISL